MSQSRCVVKRLRLLHSCNDFFILPSWSPDGTKIAFASERSGNFDIYVMDIDGQNIAQLTKHEAEDIAPVWSPNGTKIAFQTKRDGWPSEIYVINADGTNPTNLTKHHWWDGNPTWSPDGSKIMFSSSDRDGRSGFFIMNADGSNPVQFLLDSNAFRAMFPRQITGFGEPCWSAPTTLSVSRNERFSTHRGQIKRAAK